MVAVCSSRQRKNTTSFLAVFLIATFTLFPGVIAATYFPTIIGNPPSNDFTQAHDGNWNTYAEMNPNGENFIDIYQWIPGGNETNKVSVIYKFGINDGFFDIYMWNWTTNTYDILSDDSSNGTYMKTVVARSDGLIYLLANQVGADPSVKLYEIQFNTTPTDCTENWVYYAIQYGFCNANDTVELQLLYNDTEACGTTFDLAIDNGTIYMGTCDYCTPNITFQDTACQIGNTFTRNYTDQNNCYTLTNLMDDYVPTNSTETCFFEQKDFNCTVSDQPYAKDRIDYKCVMPVANVEYACINTVSYGLEDVQQVNPQKLTKTNTWLSSAVTEEREYFTSKNGLLNAYYTRKNLAIDVPFLLTTTCSNGNDTLLSQNVVTPILKPNHDLIPTMIFAGNNAGSIIIIVIGGILFVFIAAWVVKKMKGR